MKRTWGYQSIGVLFLAGLGQWAMIQKDLPWTLWVGCAFFAAAVFLLFKVLPPDAPQRVTKTLEPRVEVSLFVLILVLGVFFRVHGINRFPNGIFADRADVACQALRILHDHWRPGLETLNYHIPEWCIYYMVAGWFWLFGSSPDVFAYFDAVLSILGLLFVYTAFRQILDAKTCLLGLFILAVMRWNFVFAHQIYFQSQTVLFLFLAFSLLLYALRKKSVVAAAAAGLVLAAGLYSYQTLKIAPLFFLSFFIFEWVADREKTWKDRRIWAWFGATLFLFALPLMNWMIVNGKIGRRELDVSIFSKMDHSGMSFLGAFMDNLRYVVLLFDRLGTYNSQSDFQLHRMLDDLTGPLFILGFFYALSRARQKPFFLMVSGMGVLVVPALFSDYGGNAGRLLALTPFIAFICALLLVDGFDRFEIWRAERKMAAWSGPVVLILFLAVMAGQNYYDYFVQEVSDPVCQNDFSWPETQVGRLIAQAPPRSEFFLPAIFYGNPTIGYLSYPNWGHFHLLDLSRPPQPKDYPSGTRFVFFEDEAKVGSMEFLQKLYPGMRTASYGNPLGQIKVYAGEVSVKPGVSVQVKRGLWGEYRHHENEKPFLSRLDPVLNFSYSDLPQIGTPLLIHWSGWFRADRTGNYDLWVLTLQNGRARLLLDGKGPADLVLRAKATAFLGQGKHRLDLYFQQDPVPFGAVNLFWRKPGEKDFALMPNDVFSILQRP